MAVAQSGWVPMLQAKVKTKAKAKAKAQAPATAQATAQATACCHELQEGQTTILLSSNHKKNMQLQQHIICTLIMFHQLGVFQHASHQGGVNTAMDDGRSSAGRSHASHLL